MSWSSFWHLSTEVQSRIKNSITCPTLKKRYPRTQSVTVSGSSLKRDLRKCLTWHRRQIRKVQTTSVEQRLTSPTMRSILSTLALTALLAPVQSLYFYIEGTNPRCFYEELPKDTLVVGHYSAEEFSLDHNAYVKNDALNIFISVDVCIHWMHSSRPVLQSSKDHS